jgi:hypothetical protein
MRWVRQESAPRIGRGWYFPSHLTPPVPVGFNKLQRCPLSLLQVTVYSQLGCVTRATYTGNSGVFEVLAPVASLFRLCVSLRQS